MNSICLFVCLFVCLFEQEFLLKLEKNDIVGSFLRAEANHQEMVRDQFNTRKLIVAVTRSGKVRVCVYVHARMRCIYVLCAARKTILIHNISHDIM